MPPPPPPRAAALCAGGGAASAVRPLGVFVEIGKEAVQVDQPDPAGFPVLAKRDRTDFTLGSEAVERTPPEAGDRATRVPCGDANIPGLVGEGGSPVIRAGGVGCGLGGGVERSRRSVHSSLCLGFALGPPTPSPRRPPHKLPSPRRGESLQIGEGAGVLGLRVLRERNATVPARGGCTSRGPNGPYGHSASCEAPLARRDEDLLDRVGREWVPDKVGLGGHLHRLCRVGEDFALLEGGGEKAGLGGERWGASRIRGRPFPVSWRVFPGDGPWEGDRPDSLGGRRATCGVFSGR